MTPLAAFGICILITFVLILLSAAITGGGAFYIIYMLSIALIEETRLARKHSPVFPILLVLLIAAEIALVSSIFFGVFCLFYSFSDVHEAVSLTPQMIAARHPFFIGLNKILLLALVYFLGTFIYYRIQFSKRNAVEGTHAKYPNPILPSISFVFAFIYLIASYYYLTEYPSKESIGIPATIAGSLYALYIIYSLGKSIYIHIRHYKYIFPSYTLFRISQQLISFAYNFTFLYFFYSTAYMLKLY
ncbi:hypothetical protein [Cytophaga aurantiaca]|uniref:hypothetical protein n=1 Tax=Cytophaga aurantiaca TaxID=29530 RepID=UPI0003635043|nr:hypothetical protein [Cytophaga aurantiaca]